MKRNIENKIVLTKNILKVVRISKAHSDISNVFSEALPLSNESDSLYRIKVDKWYHNFFDKIGYKYFVWKYKRKGLCTCRCHYSQGFHHCWDNGCCKDENKQWKTEMPKIKIARKIERKLKKEKKK